VDPIWLMHLRHLQAEAQTGLEYARDPYDVERYARIRDTAAELIAELASLDPAHVRQLFAEEAGYATPKVDVRAVVVREGRVLLVRERADGLWTLPGGWADVDDAPSVAVAKEVREEAGLEVRVRKLAALYDRRLHGHPPHRYHIYKIFFLCDAEAGEPVAGEETSEAAFFPPDSLPPLSTGRVTAAQIARMLEHWRDDTLPADFD
jgi:ADP-ribose pyrophosphatase YjhB (NUDIX family)